ncbi:MAG: TetR/AcrR family transcriptional regulator [Cyanobacteriota bacterium]|nr:TetR/AcrR family transcriptional regulator [Cyanobacteriota bacterium]
MTHDPPTPLWRLPQQARSRQRFDRILDAAAELFAEAGYDSVTTDDIAARAKTSVGSLYRFFPDKLAIFHALLDRYLNQLRSLSESLHTQKVLHVPLATYISELVNAFDQFARMNPGFRTVFVQSRLIPTTVAMNAAFYQEIAQQFIVYFAARNPSLDPSYRELIATVSVEVACTLDILALSKDQTFQDQVLVEAKKLLIAYLQPHFPDLPPNA